MLIDAFEARVSDCRTIFTCGVEAGIELLFVREHGVPQTAITAVEGEDGALVGEEVHEVLWNEEKRF